MTARAETGTIEQERERRHARVARARAESDKAQSILARTIQETYPVGCTIRYTTSQYSRFYTVLDSLSSGMIRVQRAYPDTGVIRWLNGTSKMVEWYDWGTSAEASRGANDQNEA
jgi:hypothetical protein